MHRITIAYAAPSDPAGFDARYAAEHVPLVRRLPGVERFTLTRPRGLTGEAPYLVAELWFQSGDDLRAALKSPEMAETGTHAQSLGAAMSIWTGEVIDTLNA
jgi:uncharacterized protein (TIGR02118 family)